MSPRVAAGASHSSLGWPRGWDLQPIVPEFSRNRRCLTMLFRLLTVSSEFLQQFVVLRACKFHGGGKSTSSEQGRVTLPWMPTTTGKDADAISFHLRAGRVASISPQPCAGTSCFRLGGAVLWYCMQCKSAPELRSQLHRLIHSVYWKQLCRQPATDINQAIHTAKW